MWWGSLGMSYNAYYVDRNTSSSNLKSNCRKTMYIKILYAGAESVATVQENHEDSIKESLNTVTTDSWKSVSASDVLAEDQIPSLCLRHWSLFKILESYQQISIKWGGRCKCNFQSPQLIYSVFLNLSKLFWTICPIVISDVDIRRQEI